MKVVPVLVIGLAGTLAAGAASAEWSGKGRIGGVIARGNTETATANLNVDVQNELDSWKHKFGSSLLRTLSDGLTAADRWEVRAESEYSPTARSFVFGSMRYENDELTDFAYQATAAVGYGYHVIDTLLTKFDVRLGVGTRRAELRLTHDVEADEILRGTVDFERQLTPNTRMFNRLLVESGVLNTYAQNLLGLEVKMTQALSLGAGYEVRYNSQVLPETENTDQVLTLGVAVGF